MELPTVYRPFVNRGAERGATEVIGRHPARTMRFADLWAGLRAAVAAELVLESFGPDGLRLYCYSRKCVYERRWDVFTLMARGLVLDPVAGRVVATPFPKFFNAGEGDQLIPDLPFETFEKLDGSLIILYFHNGTWRTSTKGGFDSSQAKWAADRLAGTDLSGLDRGATYLAEAIYPENRIVVRYDEAGLVLIGAYRGDGAEFTYDEITAVGERLGWRVARRFSFAGISELLSLAKTLPPTEEGFVLRFSDGTRLKIKGDEYTRIHRLVTGLTPLAMWEAMRAGDDLAAIRRQLPEEFWRDFDGIITALRRRIGELIAAVRGQAEAVAGLSDKEVGLRLASFPDEYRRFIFPYRKSGGDLLSGTARDLVFRAIRPDGNQLPGYVPSSAIDLVQDESV